jgi:hypothetical protein
MRSARCRGLRLQLEGLAMMKKLALAVAVVGCLSASAFAADGRISKGSLAHMGLQGMKTISDEQGMQVRGTSFSQGGANINVWINAIAIGGDGGGGGNGGNGGNNSGGNGGNGGNANGGNATNNISVVIVTVSGGQHHR